MYSGKSDIYIGKADKHFLARAASFACGGPGRRVPPSAPSPMAPDETCALCIVGAGYAGVNALNAAAKYLPKGARVVVVDRGRCWGGQWPNQYDYVRLHQPYEQFTAGEREWSIASAKPAGHLASKQEIMCHFDDVVHSAVEEKELQLVTLFGYEYSGHNVEGGKVRLAATPLLAGVPPVTVIADRVIKAGGFDVKIKEPLRFSTRAQIHTLSPVSSFSTALALGFECLRRGAGRCPHAKMERAHELRRRRWRADLRDRFGQNCHGYYLSAHAKAGRHSRGPHALHRGARHLLHAAGGSLYG